MKLSHFIVVPLLVLLTHPVWGKSVGEAVQDMSAVQGDDPQGFTLMVVCIAMIVTVAVTLITVATIYMIKSKKPGPPPA